MKSNAANISDPISTSESMSSRIATVRKQVAGIARILTGSENQMVRSSAEILDELVGELMAIESALIQYSLSSSQVALLPIQKDEQSSTTAVRPSVADIIVPKKCIRKDKSALQKSASLSTVQEVVSAPCDFEVQDSNDILSGRSGWNDEELMFLRTCSSSSEAIRLYHLHFGNVHNDSGIHQRWLKLRRTGELLSETDVVEVIDGDSVFSGRKGKIIGWTDTRECANFQFTGDSGSYQIPVRSLRAVMEDTGHA